MLGGYQILDLRNIDLSRATTESSITDVEVLKQLSQIANYIQKTYDFSKPLNNQLKPVLIRYRDKKVGEKHEVALFGNIEVINTYYKFRIIANNEGEQLTINVEFEEKTDEYDNKYWDIKTAKVLLTSAEQTIENILADGNVENAKPIYFHPILCTSANLRVSFIILNNDETPFANMKQVVDYFRSLLTTDLTTIRVPTTGGIIISETLHVASQINITAETFVLYGLSAADGQHTTDTLVTFYSESVLVVDGVNKIN